MKRIISALLVSAFLFVGIVAPVSAQTPEEAWQSHLEEIWAQKSQAWKWGQSPAGVPVWDNTTSEVTPTTEGGKTVYSVSTPQQLAWVVQNSTSDNYTNTVVKLQNDIDLGGAKGYEWAPFASNTQVEFDGQGHTIYNMYINKPAAENVGFMGKSGENANIHNTTFSSCKVIGKKYVGVCIGFSQGQINDIRVENSIVEAKEETAAGVLGYDNASNMTIKHLYSVDNIVYGGGHIGGLGVMVRRIEDSYATGCTVISTGHHSGGFLACSDFTSTIKNCFSDCDVYGTYSTGAFAGYVTNQSSYGILIEYCYALGSVEGLQYVGGMFGIIKNVEKTDPSHQKYITVRDCYSNARVGTNSQSDTIGSFVGYAKMGSQDAADNVLFTRCYAAGEVGALEGNNKIGGFIGENDGAIFKNCFYDKQTTAMRETAIGSGDGTGITGLLTDSTKGSDAKMTGTTLKGFDNVDDATKERIWKIEDNLYPQLRVFTDNSAKIFSDERDQATAIAYSGVSVAAPKLSPWSDVPTTTAYDTVRDVITSFSLSNNPSYTLNWTQDNSKGAVNTAQSVLSLDHPIVQVNTVGRDWLHIENTVTCNEVTVKANRPVRIFVTKSLEVGTDQSREVGTKYNNWEEVTLIDSTALDIDNYLGKKADAVIQSKTNQGARKLVENATAPSYTIVSPTITDQNSQKCNYFGSKDTKSIFDGVSPLPEQYGGKAYKLEYSWVLKDCRYLTDDKTLTVTVKSPAPPPTPTDTDPPQPDNPITGDNLPIALMILLLSAAGCGIILSMKKRMQ